MAEALSINVSLKSSGFACLTWLCPKQQRSHEIIKLDRYIFENFLKLWKNLNMGGKKSLTIKSSFHKLSEHRGVSTNIPTFHK